MNKTRQPRKGRDSRSKFVPVVGRAPAGGKQSSAHGGSAPALCLPGEDRAQQGLAHPGSQHVLVKCMAGWTDR